MQKMTVAVLLLLISPAIISASATDDEPIATSKIDNVTTFNYVLVECFVAITTDDCDASSDNTVVLNWWAYSDETNSNWPDDDAKARAGELFVNLTNDDAQMIINEEITNQQANDNRNEIEDMLPVVRIVGELNVYEELGGHRIEIPIEMTPLVNLSDSTIMYIFLSKASLSKL